MSGDFEILRQMEDIYKGAPRPVFQHPAARPVTTEEIAADINALPPVQFDESAIERSRAYQQDTKDSNFGTYAIGGAA